MTKQTAFKFYRTLEKQFPRIKTLGILEGIDIEVEKWENSGIMTKLANELAQFVMDGETKEAEQLMFMVEEAFDCADSIVTSYLCTDFLVTIMEQKKEQREYLKSIMGVKTKERYKKLLSSYLELDN